MSLDSSMDKVLERRREIEERLSDTANMTNRDLAEFSRELSDLRPICDQIEVVRRIQAELVDALAMVDEAGEDADLLEMVLAETDILKAQLPKAQSALQLLLLPKDKDDARNAILEVRAGTGGDEAALFASNLFSMYQRFALKHGWKFEVMEVSETGIGGYKEATATISGNDVFARLKFEFRASGPGGQSVNTTDSAVRITHLPTGIVVSQQDEKSQHKNKAKAMKILRARIYDAERARVEAERAAERKGQVGSGDRSERIRTYNFPQGRVTDHRINFTLYKLDRVVAGEALDEVVDALVAEDQARRLSGGV
jgi:peptide chain release factor 1